MEEEREEWKEGGRYRELEMSRKDEKKKGKNKENGEKKKYQNGRTQLSDWNGSNNGSIFRVTSRAPFSTIFASLSTAR